MTHYVIGEAVTLEERLAEIGDRVAKLRLSRNITQADLAAEAGLAEKTVKRLEAGRNVSLETILRVLEVFNLGGALVQALPDPEVRPVERVRLGGRERRRASGSTQPPSKEDWEWGDE